MKGLSIISGKGGTGKTLISLNIAMQLIKNGYSVGLLDADFSNPNTAHLMGIDLDTVTPRFTPDHRLIPITFESLPNFEYVTIEVFTRQYGVGKSGIEYAKIVSELINYADWNSEYIVVDAPAGYYDTHKTIVSSFDENYLGSIVVAVPAHVNDLIRVLDLHRINDIPVLGVIENMSNFVCRKCGEDYRIFGDGNVDKICSEYGVEFFGSIPLSMEIRDMISAKTPIIPDNLSEPIIKALGKIVEAKPRKAGFLKEFIERVDDALSRSLMKLVVEVLLAINAYVPIPYFQEKFNFPGGRVIRLNLLDKSMSNPVVTADFILEEGKLKILQKRHQNPDVQIDMYYKALVWALLGEKNTDKGPVKYDFWRAIWNDEVRIYSPKSYDQMRSWYFLHNVLQDAMEKGASKIVPLLKVIA